MHKVAWMLNVTAQTALPLSRDTIVTSEDWVGPSVQLGSLLCFRDNLLLVQFDTETRRGEELDGTVLDLEDLGVLHVCEQVETTGVVMHFPRHLTDDKIGC